MVISKKVAERIGKKLYIDFDEIPLSQFHEGMQVELEHGLIDKKTNVTNNSLIKTGKIALTHLKESNRYYAKLKIMEKGLKNAKSRSNKKKNASKGKA